MFQNWTASSISLDWPTHRTYITDFSVSIGLYLLSICSNSSSWLKWPHMSHLSVLTHIKTTPCIVSYLISHPNVAICHSWHNKLTCLNCAYRADSLVRNVHPAYLSYKTALYVINAHIFWLTHLLKMDSRGVTIPTRGRLSSVHKLPWVSILFCILRTI